MCIFHLKIHQNTFGGRTSSWEAYYTSYTALPKSLAGIKENTGKRTGRNGKKRKSKKEVQRKERGRKGEETKNGKEERCIYAATLLPCI